MRYRAHIKLIKGFYRVLWHDTMVDLLFTADQVPYRKRNPEHTRKATAFVHELNDRKAWRTAYAEVKAEKPVSSSRLGTPLAIL